MIGPDAAMEFGDLIDLHKKYPDWHMLLRIHRMGGISIDLEDVNFRVTSLNERYVRAESLNSIFF